MATTEITECQNDGDKMKLYYSLSGDCDSPVWVEHVGIINDLNLADTDDEQQVNRRGSVNSIKKYNPGDTDLAVTGTQIVQGNYQGFQVLNSAKKGGAPRHLMILSGALSDVNSIGYAGHWYNLDRSISGPAEGEQEGSFNLRPAACVVEECEVKAVKVLVSGTAADWDQSVISS